MGEYLLDNYDVFVHGANVREQAHTILNSGLHTDVKINMERVIDHPLALDLIHSRTDKILREIGAEAVLPVPEGALRIAREARLPHIIASSRIQRKPPEFLLGNEDRPLIRALGCMAIFEDVVTTGRNPASLAKTIRKVNPDAELHLVGLWRRGEVSPEYAELFSSQTYLVDKPIPAWEKEQCYDCPLPA